MLADSNCPPQPFPVDLPDTLPEEIQNALTALDKVANATVNSVSVVSSLIKNGIISLQSSDNILAILNYLARCCDECDIQRKHTDDQRLWCQ